MKGEKLNGKERWSHPTSHDMNLNMQSGCKRGTVFCFWFFFLQLLKVVTGCFYGNRSIITSWQSCRATACPSFSLHPGFRQSVGKTGLQGWDLFQILGTRRTVGREASTGNLPHSHTPSKIIDGRVRCFQKERPIPMTPVRTRKQQPASLTAELMGGKFLSACREQLSVVRGGSEAG